MGTDLATLDDATGLLGLDKKDIVRLVLDGQLTRAPFVEEFGYRIPMVPMDSIREYLATREADAEYWAAARRQRLAATPPLAAHPSAPGFEPRATTGPRRALLIGCAVALAAIVITLAVLAVVS